MEWKTVPLQSLCNDFKQDIVDGPFGSELQRKDYITDGVPVLKIQNVHPFEIELKKMDYVSAEKFAELRRHSFRRGDIVMTKLGSPLGVSAVIEELDEGMIVADLVRIRAQQVNTRYLCYHLNSSATSDYINSMQKGTTRPRVTLSVVRQLPIAVPSLPEQRRIVAILDEAFEGIATAKANSEKNLRNARELFKAQLEQVFSEPSQSWRRVALESVGTTQTGSTPKTSEPENLGDYMPFVKPGDFNRDGSITFDNEGLSESGAKKARLVKPNSALMVCIGATIGKAGFSEREIATNQQINAWTPTAEVSAKFVYYQMTTADFLRRVRLSAGQATLPIINKSKWSALTVVVPPTLDEQHKIVAHLEAVLAESMNLEAVLERKLKALDELKKSLLYQAFTGQLGKAITLS
ncbi:MAG: restriction endonuclease subunit S [Burkholderiaceae bacterium]